MSKYKMAIPFKLNNELNNSVEEFNILFEEGKNSFEKLLEFLHAYPNTNINIEYKGSIPMGIVMSLNKMFDNVYTRVTAENFYSWKELKENNCKFFFDASYPAYNLASLQEMISMGVTSVYPADDLLYNLEDTAKYCHENEIKMRLVLNRIPSTLFYRGENYLCQIYSPRDMELLDKFIDIFEFDCQKPYDWAKFDVLFRAWFKKEDWHGDLREINDDLVNEFNVLTIPGGLADYKAKCGLRCVKRTSNKCRKCFQFIDISKQFLEKNIYIKKDGQK